MIVPWRPALVAFIGFGAGASFTLGFTGGESFGNIGWVPLAPFEPYHPWWGNRYGAAGGSVTNITNITNITNVTTVTNVNVYRNVQYNAVSSVSSQHFLQGDFSRTVAVSAPELRAAHVFRSAVPVVPTASNLRFTAAPAVAAVAVNPGLHAGAFAGGAPVVRRTPFTAQRIALAAAAHTAITPLHFKDAQSTPIMPADAAGVGRMPAHSDGVPDGAPTARRFTSAHSPGDAPSAGDEPTQSRSSLERAPANESPAYRPATPNHQMPKTDDAPYHQSPKTDGAPYHPVPNADGAPYHQAPRANAYGATRAVTQPHEAGSAKAFAPVPAVSAGKSAGHAGKPHPKRPASESQNP